MTDAKETAMQILADEGQKWDTGMPERIWARASYRGVSAGMIGSFCENPEASDRIEYARADLLTKAQADLAAANAEISRLRAATRNCAPNMRRL